ncbi:MAG: O-antigen ligase family protein [Reinekea sp.]
MNTFGVICAISFFYSTVRLKTGSVLFFFNLCLIALSLLLLDSRSAIILSVLGFIALIVKFPEKVYLWGFRAVVLLLPASTFIAILLSSVLSGSLSESAVARNDTDIETFANRTIIWGAVFDVYSSFDVDHLFGFGVKGQVNSGVAEKNHQIFIKREDDYKSKTVHNLMLQSLLDIGYVGSFFFLVMLLSLNFKHSDYSKLLYSSLGAMLVAGFAEASPMIYQSELFYIFIVLVIIGLRPVSPQRANGMSNALS